WLRKNHAKKRELWVIYYKKHAGKRGMVYDEAVEEAICYGWIDSTVKRLDYDRTVQRFTPRNPKSGWSELNLTRARKLIKQGKITKAGMEKLGDALERECKRKINPETPEDLRKALGKNKKARENFENFAPCYKRHYIWHIEGAKMKETRERRIRFVVDRAALNKKPGVP
ncbi:MAG: YdeI/OmpD-associated family protein, partial [Candidatus Diapherotrites archaeon]